MKATSAPLSRRFQIAFVVTVALLGALVAALLGAPGAEAARDTVHITGRAYEFGKPDVRLTGATIRVRELPRVTAVADDQGDYDLEVPNDTNVTPYIDPPAGYNEIDLQTLHTRGHDLENVNFQTPSDAAYLGLAAILGVELGDDGRPTECAVVTTVSARNVRDVPFETFVERTPHGVAGATASSIPGVTGPIYFNDMVIPDPSRTESSGDGGIAWTSVPVGSYRLTADHPSTRFASFLATCAPGRVVNANPPWGMYELADGERPLGASVVAASPGKAKAKRKGKRRRFITFRIDTGEAIGVRAALRKGGEAVTRRTFSTPGSGRGVFKLPIGNGVGRGRAKLVLKLDDAAGDRVVERQRLRVPRRRGR